MHQLQSDARSNDIFSCKILALTLSLIRQVSSANNLVVQVIALEDHLCIAGIVKGLMLNLVRHLTVLLLLSN